MTPQFLLVTPLALELKSLRAGLLPGRTAPQNGEIDEFDLHGAHFALGLGGHGKVECGLRVQRFLLTFPSVKTVILCGSAGALTPDFRPGDFVIAETVIEHDFKSQVEGARLPEFRTDENLRCALLEASPLFRSARVASGDEDITTEARAREIHLATSARAVAWEGAGVARACGQHGCSFLEIRGITDHANHNTLADFKANARRVMEALGEELAKFKGWAPSWNPPSCSESDA